MGFLKRLLGIGVTAGAAVAAVKVAEQVKENNPDGISDVNGDGKVDAKDVLSEVAKAATEVYHDTVDAVTGAASAAREYAPEYAGKAKDAVTGAVETVKEKAPEYAGKVKDAATGAAEALRETVPTVFEKVKDAVAGPFAEKTGNSDGPASEKQE